MKEKKVATELIGVTIGPKASQDILRTAMAMGIDRGIHIETDLRPDQELQPLAVAKALESLIKKEDPSLVILGKQSIDSDNGQVGQLLGGLLNWPQGTYTIKLDIADNKANIERETDAGSEEVTLNLPAVLTTDLRLNTPRYATLPNIMKAKKKPIDVISLESLGIDTKPRNVVVKVEEPPVRKAGIFVENVDQLVEKLKNEAKVL